MADDIKVAKNLEASGVKVRKVRLQDLQNDTENANQHTARGKVMLRRSIVERRFGRPMFGAADQTVLAGNNTREVLLAEGVEEVLVVETDGSRPIVHVRTDLESAESAEARTLAIEDNRIAQVSLNWDAARLVKVKEAGVDLSRLFDKLDSKALGAAQAVGGGIRELYMIFGKYKVPLSQEELELLEAALEQHVEEVGVKNGFVERLLPEA